MDKSQKTVVLATGGTGGHVFPAQALAQELIRQGYKVFIFSDGRGHQFKDGSFTMVEIPTSSLRGSVGKRALGALKLIAGVGTAMYHLHRLKPSCVVGFGGHASFPTMIATATLRRPTIIHQADAYFGRTNRLLASLMTRIATSLPEVANIPPSAKGKVSYTGLPLRPDIQPAPYNAAAENDVFHILVTGGSQGAKVFGEIIPRAISLLDSSLQKRLHITQQCRTEFLTSTNALYAKTKARVELSPFLDQMGERYKQAHLVISRSGASSVLEAASVGRPALFIPYPYAMDNHQFYNAQQAVHVEGGWLIEEKDFTSHRLANFLAKEITSPWKLTRAAANIQKIVIPDAAKRLADLVAQLAD